MVYTLNPDTPYHIVHLKLLYQREFIDLCQVHQICATSRENLFLYV